jgi:DNA-binding beta-propeller fold protein YncE
LSGYTGGGLNKPVDLAIDGTGNVWVANAPGNSVSEFNSNGTAISGPAGYTANGLYEPTNIAIDCSGNVWVAESNYYLSELIGAASPVVTPLATAVKNNTVATRP